MNLRNTPTASPSQSLNSRHPRRKVLAFLSGSGLVVAIAGIRLPAQAANLLQNDTTPTADDAGGTPAPFSAQVFAGDGFVGEAKDVPTGEAFVAVVVADAKPGAEAREARAIIYGDTENEIQEWFPGAVTGDKLDLVSEGGARLQGEFSPEGATGTITLADGTVLPFDAVPSTGVAGLYTVTVFPDGRVEGTSERGVRLEGHLGTQAAEPDTFPMTGTLTPPDGEPLAFEVMFRTLPEAEMITARFVVLDDGRIRGGAKQKDDRHFTCPMID
jgi:hypothetical protein